MLIDYLKTYKQKGYSDEQLKKTLLAQGYPEKNISDSLKEANKQLKKSKVTQKNNQPASFNQELQKENSNSKKIIVTSLIVVLVILIIAVVLGSLFLNDTISFENGLSLNFGSNSQDDQETNPEQEINCDTCQYRAGDLCIDYICCENSDCDDSNPYTDNICENPSTVDSRCVHPKKQAEKADADDTSDNTSHDIDTDQVINETKSTVSLLDNNTDSMIEQDQANNNDSNITKKFPVSCETDSDCDDENIMTKDVCRTDKTCSVTIIKDCIDDDNYCPIGCRYDDDNDCDPLSDGKCMEDKDCDDDNSSTKDICLINFPEKIGMCENSVIEKCEHHDGECPSHCTTESDTDCVAGDLDDCSKDYDCFIEASLDCSPAKKINILSEINSGVNTTTETYSEIRGNHSGQCVYYEEIIKINLTYTEESRTELLNQGFTEEEIDSMEAENNEAAGNSIGAKFVCLYEHNELSSLLENWKDGNFSIEIQDEGDCEKIDY